MKTDQVAVEPENVDKAVKRTVQTDMNGKELPEVKGLMCPFTMSECIKESCQVWHKKLGNCNFAFVGEILEHVRTKH